jgi:hypothetical protein
MTSSCTQAYIPLFLALSAQLSHMSEWKESTSNSTNLSLMPRGMRLSPLILLRQRLLGCEKLSVVRKEAMEKYCFPGCEAAVQAVLRYALQQQQRSRQRRWRSPSRKM